MPDENISGDTERVVGNDFAADDARMVMSIRPQRNRDLQPSRTTLKTRTEQASGEVAPLDPELDPGIANPGERGGGRGMNAGMGRGCRELL